MNPIAYREMEQTEEVHWWFCARRTILSKIIKGLNLPHLARILEIGCGTGGNLEMLSRFGTVSAIEMDATAIEMANKKTKNRYDIKNGYCPDVLPATNTRFDLICLFDVLEHIEEDTKTLQLLSKLLEKKGRILLTVPAYEWLFGPHDVLLHHKRRYNAKLLRERVTSSGLKMTKLSYFNTILFPLALITRCKDKLLRSTNATGTKPPKPFLNFILKKIFECERFLLEKINLPFGVSLLCILEASE
jgi:SAM-dependent methyltransferase